MGPGLILTIAAAVVFLLVGLELHGDVDAIRLLGFGLAAFAAAHIPWPNWGPGPRQ